jgi:hypothetical protein
VLTATTMGIPFVGQCGLTTARSTHDLPSDSSQSDENGDKKQPKKKQKSTVIVCVCLPLHSFENRKKQKTTFFFIPRTTPHFFLRIILFPMNLHFRLHQASSIENHCCTSVYRSVVALV